MAKLNGATRAVCLRGGVGCGSVEPRAWQTQGGASDYIAMTRKDADTGQKPEARSQKRAKFAHTCILYIYRDRERTIIWLPIKSYKIL